MENKETILVIRQKAWEVYVFPLIICICIDFAGNYQLFEDLILYHSLFYVYIIVFFYYSFFARKITLTNELLIFDYYLWFAWRRKTFKIDDIKSFYYNSSKTISLEIRLYSRMKSINFELTGFREKSIRELYYELYNHPLNKLESSFE